MKRPALVRIAVSLVALGALLGLSLISLEPTRPTSLFDPSIARAPFFPRLSWLGFGAAPLLTGFMIVELLAVMVPPLRWRRVSGEGPRRPLVYASWSLGLAIAALEAWSFSRTSDLTLGAMMMAGTLASWGIVVAAGRYGLLNGFAVAALASLGALDDVMRVQRVVVQEEVAPGAVLVLVIVLAAAVWASLFLARRAAPTVEVPVRAPPPVSGLGMTASAGALLSFPATLANFFPVLRSPSQALQSSQVLFTSLWAGLAVLLTVGWSLAFFRPRAVAAVWKRWNPQLDETSAILAARALLPIAIRDALVLNVAFTVALELTLHLGGGLVSVALVTTLIVLDGLDEWRFRLAHGELASVLEVQRVPEVDAVLHRLTASGIPAVARSRHYRASLQFFGPNVPVEVLVPVTRADEAKALLAT